MTQPISRICKVGNDKHICLRHDHSLGTCSSIQLFKSMSDFGIEYFETYLAYYKDILTSAYIYIYILEFFVYAG